MPPSDDESRRMLKPQKDVSVSEIEMDETSPALEEAQSQRTAQDDGGARGAIPSIQSQYMTANTFAVLRSLLALWMLGGAARILAMGCSPTVFPFAVFAVVCSSVHVLLAAHRVVRPRSLTSPMPPRRYLAVLAASPLVLLAAVGHGLAVAVMTRDKYDERDPSRTTYRCGKSGASSGRKCHPKTRDADVFDMTVFATSFAFAMLLCCFGQIRPIYLLGRTKYTAEEIEQAHRSFINVSPGAILKQTIVNPWRRRKQ